MSHAHHNTCGDVVRELIGERLHRFIASVPLDDVIAHLKRVE